MWDFSANFWTGVGLAAAAATAVATVTSTAIGLWWRRVDTRRPEWVFFGARSIWSAFDRYGNGEHPHAKCSLGNAGQGPGFRVRVEGVGCHVWAHGEMRYSQGARAHFAQDMALVPAFAAGEKVELHVYCEPADWDQAAIAIFWREPSAWRTRHRRRVRAEPLRNVAARPRHTSSDWDPEAGSVEQVLPEPVGPVLPEERQAQHPLPPGGVLARLRHRARLRRLA